MFIDYDIAIVLVISLIKDQRLVKKHRAKLKKLYDALGLVLDQSEPVKESKK
jgi:hypothetical protein